MVEKEKCAWCGNIRELVDSQFSDAFLVPGPHGSVLRLRYGLVCVPCWDRIEKQWRRTGDLSQPLLAFA